MITVTGNFEAITGASTGYVTATLMGYGADVPRVNGTGIIVQPSVSSPIGPTFSLPLFANDAITPANTFYQFAFHDGEGNLLADGYYTLSGSASVDISTLTPITPLVALQPLPILAKVATTGDYNDLLNKPIISSVLSPVAYSGSYNDLSSKPNLAAVATSGNYNDLSNRPARTGAICWTLDCGGSVLPIGPGGTINIPANCTVTGWVLTADQVGSVAVDVCRSTYATYPALISIAGTDVPTLSSSIKNENLSITAWGSTALNPGDQLQFNVLNATSVTRISITLIVTLV